MAWDGLRRDGRLNAYVKRQGGFPVQLWDVKQMQTELISQHFRLNICTTRNELRETPREQPQAKPRGIDC
jgi:predicted ATPase